MYGGLLESDSNLVIVEAGWFGLIFINTLTKPLDMIKKTTSLSPEIEEEYKKKNRARWTGGMVVVDIKVCINPTQFGPIYGSPNFTY